MHFHSHNQEGGHAHVHAPQALGNEQRQSQMKRLKIAFMMMFLFVVFEFLAGLFSNSLVLLADAGHMLGDAGAMLLTFMSFKIADREATPRFSYGYKRVEILAALVNCLMLLGMSAWIFLEAFWRFTQGKVEVHGATITIVACVGIALNGVILLLVQHKGNLNIKSALLHVVWDLIGAVAALVTGVLITLTKWSFLDSLVSVLLACFLLQSTYYLLKESFHILMEATPKDFNIEACKAALQQNVANVLNIHHLHVWSLTNENRVLTMHVSCTKDTNRDALLVALKSYVKEHYGIGHSTIQIEEEGQCAD